MLEESQAVAACLFARRHFWYVYQVWLLEQVREAIEASGRDARWEFSVSLLFGRTNHMAGVCADLSSMVGGIRSLQGFLGPELKAATGDMEVHPASFECEEPPAIWGV